MRVKPLLIGSLLGVASLAATSFGIISEQTVAFLVVIGLGAWGSEDCYSSWRSCFWLVGLGLAAIGAQLLMNQLFFLAGSVRATTMSDVLLLREIRATTAGAMVGYACILAGIVGLLRPVPRRIESGKEEEKHAG